jgi:hypothetical protein
MAYARAEDDTILTDGLPTVPFSVIATYEAQELALLRRTLQVISPCPARGRSRAYVCVFSPPQAQEEEVERGRAFVRRCLVDNEVLARSSLCCAA